MEDGVTIVLTFIDAKPGYEDTIREELRTVARETVKEPGSLSFVAHQSAEHPTEFVVYERWRERGDVDKHIALPHVQHLMKVGEEAFANPVRVTFWDALEPA